MPVLTAHETKLTRIARRIKREARQKLTEYRTRYGIIRMGHTHEEPKAVGRQTAGYHYCDYEDCEWYFHMISSRPILTADRKKISNLSSVATWERMAGEPLTTPLENGAEWIFNTGLTTETECQNDEEVAEENRIKELIQPTVGYIETQYSRLSAADLPKFRKALKDAI